MAITALPTPPSRAAPSTFSTLADAFIAALPTFVTEANAQAAALELNDTTDASASSVAIGLGAKTFTVTAAKSFQPGMWLVIADDAAPSTNAMYGTVTSYSGTTLVMDIKSLIGSGTKSAWTISQSAPMNLLTVATDTIWDAAGDLAVGTGANTAAALTGAMFGLMNRAKFGYSDADQITVGAAMYMCKDKYCYWTSTLTSIATGAAGGADWWYYYLDYSEITSGTEIVTAKIIWSTTEPAWNDTYRQWMNGDDRCIFAVNVQADNTIYKFYHSGESVFWDAEVTELDGVDIDDTFTDIDLVSSMPKFSTLGIISLGGAHGDGASNAQWRVNGSSSSAGLRSNRTDVGATVAYAQMVVVTDSAQIFELRNSNSNANVLSVYGQGWKFPAGM